MQTTTLKVYLPSGGYGGSPHPGSSAHSSGSPSQSYDTRHDTSMTSLSSGETNIANLMNGGDQAAVARYDDVKNYSLVLS